MRSVSSHDLMPGERVVIRELLDRAFGKQFDEDDWQHAQGGVHVLVFDGDSLVSHASVVRRTLVVGDRQMRTGYVEAVATEPARQGQGYGTAAMREVNRIIQDGFELGALSTGASDFYVRIGWELWLGPTFVDSPAGWVRTAEDDGGVFVLRTPATHDLDVATAIMCDRRSGEVW